MTDDAMTGFLQGRDLGMKQAQAAQTAVGMTPQQKVAMALQAHRGLFPNKGGMGGGMNALGQAGLLLAGMRPPASPGGM